MGIALREPAGDLRLNGFCQRQPKGQDCHIRHSAILPVHDKDMDYNTPFVFRYL